MPSHKDVNMFIKKHNLPIKGYSTMSINAKMEAINNLMKGPAQSVKQEWNTMKVSDKILRAKANIASKPPEPEKKKRKRRPRKKKALPME